MNICTHDSYSCSELPKPSAPLSYCSKHDPSTLDHYLISTSWCPCIACICHGLHGNPAHVSTQMDSILHAARHIVLDRLQVDSMFLFFFYPQRWNIGGCVFPRRRLRRWPQPPALAKLKSYTFLLLLSCLERKCSCGTWSWFSLRATPSSARGGELHANIWRVAWRRR